MVYLLKMMIFYSYVKLPEVYGDLVGLNVMKNGISLGYSWDTLQ